MTKIGVRELRQNASAYLARVQEGEVIEVTSRGKTVARIVPVVETLWEDRLTAVVTYDAPMARAAQAMGYPVVSPGGADS